jgi:hypothetical protein
MIVAEDLTEDSCADDSSLGARVTVARLCGGGLSMGGLEGAAQNKGQSYVEGPELAESVSANGTPDVVPRWVERVAQELARCSSCSSSGSRCHVVEVGREGLESSTTTPGWSEPDGEAHNKRDCEPLRSKRALSLTPLPGGPVSTF